MIYRSLRARGAVAVFILAVATAADAQPPASAQPGPAACPPGGSSTGAGATNMMQLQQLITQLGSMTPDIQTRLGLMQMVLQARGAAAARGECDLSMYDAQLTLLVNDVRALATGAQSNATLGAPAGAPPGIPPPMTSPGPPSPPGAQSPMPTLVSPPLPGTSPSDAALASNLKGDIASKLGDALQMLLGKMGSGGGSPGGGGSPPPGGGSSGYGAPPPDAGSAPSGYLPPPPSGFGSAGSSSTGSGPSGTPGTTAPAGTSGGASGSNQAPPPGLKTATDRSSPVTTRPSVQQFRTVRPPPPRHQAP